MNTVPITNEKYLHRELSSKAILSSDRAAINRYREQTAIIERNKQQLSEVETLKAEITEIKQLLLQLLSKNVGI